MLGINIQTNDAATEAVLDLDRDIDLDQIAPIIGESGKNAVRNHLDALDSKRRNRLGGRRTHFYGDAAKSTNFRITSNGVEVAINHVGIAQRYFGGTIKPVNARNIAVPAAAEAHGKRPREFGNLRLVFGGKGVNISVEGRIKRFRMGLAKKDSGARAGKLLYRLVKSVTQEADKTVLPKDDEILDHVAGDVKAYLDMQEKRQQ